MYLRQTDSPESRPVGSQLHSDHGGGGAQSGQAVQLGIPRVINNGSDKVKGMFCNKMMPLIINEQKTYLTHRMFHLNSTFLSPMIKSKSCTLKPCL